MTRYFMLALMLFGLVFAVPTGLSVEINGGDDYTNDTSVSLSLSQSGAENCSLSNDAGFSPNITYAYDSLPIAWDLAGGDGTKTVYFKCVDSGGNWSGAVSDSITLDTTAPSVSSKAPTGTSVTDRTPEISADISDTDSGVDSTSIVLRLDGSIVSHGYSSGEVSYTPSSDLSVSSHTVNLVVADDVGNLQNTSWSFTIKSEGVDIEDLAPPDGNYTDDTRPDIEFTLVDTGTGINDSTLTMKLDGDAVDIDNVDKSGQDYSYRPTTLTEGEHTVEVCVKDDVGEQTCVTWDFFVDTTEPYIGLLVPSDGDVVTDAPYISARIEDDESGVDDDAIFMTLNGVDVTSAAHYDGSTETLTFSPTVDLTPGIYNVEVWASDNIGNEANEEWSFSVSSDAPAISQLKPSDGSTVTDSTPEISAKITDTGTSGIDVDSIRLYLDGDQITGDAVYNAGSGVLTYTPASELDDGEHDVEVRARNNNRDETVQEWSFTIDSSAPGSPTGFTVKQNESGTYLSWNALSGSEYYVIYGAINSFTSTSGKAPLATLDSDETEYFHDVTSKYYYALVAEDEHGNEAPPVFAGTCDTYTASGGWTDYGCCKDSDCETAYTCDLTTHTCKRATGTAQEDDAEDAIDEAESKINAAKKAGKNVTEAQDYLEDAENAFAAGNYEQAEHFAQLAKNSALSAELLPESEAEGDKKELPCCPSTFILLAVLGFVAMRK